MTSAKGNNSHGRLYQKHDIYTPFLRALGFCNLTEGGLQKLVCLSYSVVLWFDTASDFFRLKMFSRQAKGFVLTGFIKNLASYMLRNLKPSQRTATLYSSRSSFQAPFLFHCSDLYTINCSTPRHPLAPRFSIPLLSSQKVTPNFTLLVFPPAAIVPQYRLESA